MSDRRRGRGSDSLAQRARSARPEAGVSGRASASGVGRLPARAVGRRTVIRAPPFSRFSAMISPPCCSTILEQSHRPSPVPPSSASPFVEVKKFEHVVENGRFDARSPVGDLQDGLPVQLSNLYADCRVRAVGCCIVGVQQKIDDDLSDGGFRAVGSARVSSSTDVVSIFGATSSTAPWTASERAN